MNSSDYFLLLPSLPPSLPPPLSPSLPPQDICPFSFLRYIHVDGVSVTLAIKLSEVSADQESEKKTLVSLDGVLYKQRKAQLMSILSFP